MSLSYINIQIFYKIKYALLVLFIFFTACFAEDMSQCGSGISFSFKYELNNKYWELGKPVDLFPTSVKYLTVLVFDSEDKYFDSFYAMNIPEDKNFKISGRLPEGRYTAIVWGSSVDNNDYMLCHMLDPLKDQYIEKLEKGVTTISDFRLMVKRQYGYEQGRILVSELSDIFHGYIPSFHLNAQTEAITHLTVNLVKNTKHLDVVVRREGWDEGSLLNQKPFDVYCIGHNSQYDFKNNLITESHEVKFVPVASKNETAVSRYNMNMLRLIKGHSPVLYIDDVNLNSHFMTINLIEAILKHPKYNTQEDLDREDYFEIEVRIYPNMSVEVFVNGWKSYEIDIEI